jgi:hypothetical protein
MLTYDATNDSGSKTQVTPAGQINPDKRQVKAQETPFMVEMAPDTFTTNSISVENGLVGEKLTFTVLQNDGSYTPVTLTIPVKGDAS